MTAKYKGKLARPSAPVLDAHPCGAGTRALIGDERAAAIDEAYRQAMDQHVTHRLAHDLEGILLLCEHYQLSDEPDPAARFLMLALRLAKDHVPYFQSGPKPGRPTASEIDHLKLWAAVQRKYDDLNKPGVRARHTLSNAIKKSGVSRTAYYQARKAAFPMLLAAARETLGPTAFWRIYSDTFEQQAALPVTR